MASDGVDYLEEDDALPSGQRFALVSFVGPDLAQKNDMMGMKIRGCFATQDEAAAHVKKLRKQDTIMHIYMVEVGKWMPIPPPKDVEDSAETEFQEQYMQEMMKGYKENQEKAKTMFKERVANIKKDGLDAHLTDEERIAPPTEPMPPPRPLPPLVVEPVPEGLDRTLDLMAAIDGDGASTSGGRP